MTLELRGVPGSDLLARTAARPTRPTRPVTVSAFAVRQDLVCDASIRS